MCKVGSFVRRRVTKVGLRLAARLGAADMVEELAASSPEYVRGVLATKIQEFSNSDLDHMIADCEAENFSNEYLARVYHVLKGSGIDVLQDLRNEKFLREHREKHGKISERS